MASNQLAGLSKVDFSISSTLSNLIESTRFYEAFSSISFSHHFTIITKIKTWEGRIFYIESAAFNFWSLAVLIYHIENNLIIREGKLPNNFESTVAKTLKASALKVFKDEYLLDFISGDEPDDERHIEQQEVLNIRNFILQMGKGFCFIGNQYRLEVNGDEFFVDLLFFNRYLQCLVAFDLKKAEAGYEDVGQMNMYLNYYKDNELPMATITPSVLFYALVKMRHWWNMLQWVYHNGYLFQSI